MTIYSHTTGDGVITSLRLDWHCHLLPALDDGIRDLDEAVEAARVLVRHGFEGVVCTPHRMKGVYEPAPAAILSVAEELRLRLLSEDIPLPLFPASEYYLDEFLPTQLDPPQVAPRGLLLVELPPRCPQQWVMESIRHLIRLGHTPLIAHPERSDLLAPEIRRSGFLRKKTEVDFPPLLRFLHESGCLFQGNIGSFAGIYGENVRNCALRLLEGGWYGRMGTDLHRAEGAERWMEKGLAVIRTEAGAEALDRFLLV